MVLAWPVETAFRAGVTIHGKKDDKPEQVFDFLIAT